MSARIASNTSRKRASYRFSSASNLLAKMPLAYES